MANKIKIATFSLNTFDAAADYEQTAQACLDFWRGKLDKVVCDKPDLIVLPECANRPGNFRSVWQGEQVVEYLKVAGDRLVDLAADYARKYNTNFCVSQHRWLGEERFNCSTFLNRDGTEAGIYKKNHLVVDEHTAGTSYSDEAELIQMDFGTVGGVICFDLNFEPIRKKYEQLQPDLLVFSSMYHGGGEQAIWPYYCRSHFVGAMGVNLLPAQIRNPFGQVLHSTTNYVDSVVGEVNLDCVIAHFDYNWEKFDELKRKFGPDVTIYDPGLFGSVLITSNTDELTAKQMAAECEVELLDDYIQRALNHRCENL